MQSSSSEDTFTVYPDAVPITEAEHCRWSVYLIRVDLVRPSVARALKIGMVGSGTVGHRLAEHTRAYGPVELVDVWTLAHAVRRLDDTSAWRVVEQYEARLQFAPEFVDPLPASGDSGPMGSCTPTNGSRTINASSMRSNALPSNR